MLRKKRLFIALKNNYAVNYLLIEMQSICAQENKN